MQAKSKKLKTIQMKYPAPYSHSWTEDNLNTPSTIKKKTRVTGQIEKTPPAAIRSHPTPKEKVNKREKNRCPSIGVTQITFPVPFTKSPAPNAERRMYRVRKNATASRRPSQKVNRAIDPYSSWPPPPTVRPDPTAAHLKYGVFQPPKNKPNTIPTKAPTPHLVPHRVHRTVSVERTHRKKAKIAKGTAGEQGDTSPTVAATPKQLTISPPTHLDIKPKEGWKK